MIEPERRSLILQSVDVFKALSDQEKAEVFTDTTIFSIDVQKLMVGLATIDLNQVSARTRTEVGKYSRNQGSLSLSMARAVSNLDEPNFTQAVDFLLRTPYLTKFEPESLGQPRLLLHQVMKDFINGPLSQMWQEQQGNTSS
jgi:hypothetical protein